MSKQKLVLSITSHRGRIACVVLWLLAASSNRAQEGLPTGIRLDTALFTFFPGKNHSVEVTVTETGPPTAVSNVRIVFLDATDRILLRGRGVARPGEPVSLELPLDMAERRVKVRASITIFGPLGFARSPIVVMEDLDPESITSIPKVSCSAPVGRDGPVLPFCPDVSATLLTVGE